MNKTTILTLALCAGLLSACTEDKVEAPASKAEAPTAASVAPAVKPDASSEKANAPSAQVVTPAVQAPAVQDPALTPFGGGLNAYNAHKEQLRLEAQQAEEARRAGFKKADRSVPFELYREINDGKWLALKYQTMTGGDPDRSVLADIYDSTLYQEGDAFKRNDRIKAFMPTAQAEMAEIAVHSYYAMNIKVGLGEYDFDQKAFKLNGVNREGESFSIKGAGKHFVAFVNGQDYQWIKVEDESEARRIEALRTSDDIRIKAFRGKAYFFAANAHPGEKVNLIESELIRLEIFDSTGALIATL